MLVKSTLVLLLEARGRFNLQQTKKVDTTLMHIRCSKYNRLDSWDNRTFQS